MELINAFFADARVQAVFWLCIFEVGTAVIAAIKLGIFDIHRLANFWRSRVVPYMLGCLLLYAVTRNLPTGVLGPYAVFVDEGLFSVAWLTLIYTLLADAWVHLRVIGYGLPDGPGEPSK